MKYTAVNKKNIVTKSNLNEGRPLMEHEICTEIVGKLRGRENCRDRSTDRLLKASSVQGYTGLVNSDETEASDVRNGRAMHRGLSAGADCPGNNGNGSQSHNFDITPSSANSAWSNYMNRVRSLTNMGQELAHRLATRAENRRQNAQNHVAQTPLEYDGGYSRSHIPRNNAAFDARDEPRAPRRLFNPRIPQPVSVSCDQRPGAPQSSIPTSRIPRTRTRNEQGTNVPPPQGSRVNLQPPVSVSCDPGPSASQLPVRASRIPRNRTCNEQETVVAICPNNKDNATAPRIAERACPNPRCSIPLSRDTPRFHPQSPREYERRRLSMERFLDECESSYMRPLGSPCETTPAGEHYPTNDVEATAVTYQPSMQGHPNNEDNAIAPRIAERACPNPRCSIPLSRDTPRFHPQSPREYERRRLSMERFLNECESSYMRPLGSPCETTPAGEHPSGHGSPQPNIPGPSVPQCPPRTSTPRYQTHDEHAASQQFTPVQQEQNDAIRITGTFNAQAHSEGPRTMEAQHSQPSPPELTRCPECDSPNDELQRFLNQVNDNDPSPPRRLTFCSEHRPQPNDFDALVGFLDRVHNNDAVPEAACTQGHGSLASSGYGSLRPNNQGSSDPRRTPPSPRYDTYEEALNRHRTPAQQEQNRSIQIAGSFNAQIVLELPAIQDITPPSDYFDSDLDLDSDGTDEYNGC